MKVTLIPGRERRVALLVSLVRSRTFEASPGLVLLLKIAECAAGRELRTIDPGKDKNALQSSFQKIRCIPC